MWLINASSYALEPFVDESVAPPYAILSHTWEQDEVSFRDFENLDHARSKAGFERIRYTCQQALEDGLRYAWVDTCCIDKSSSSELSEAINAMFAWYEGAEYCYFYMSDVPSDCIDLCDDLDPDDQLKSIRNGSPLGPTLPLSHSLRHLELFSRSRWFTRGWTLQELLAPPVIMFYARDWRRIGPLSRVLYTVSDVTEIGTDILMHNTGLESCLLAEKFSWASRRTTTRVEDMAYCLLGLCGVNMPLLYGERSRAFQRLQEELLRTSNDISSLGWSDEKNGVRESIAFLDGRCIGQSTDSNSVLDGLDTMKSYLQ